MTDESRYYCFDFLRVVGAFAVIVIHVAASKWYTTDIHTFEWETMNFYDSIVRWAVPVFVMISGALFLSRDIPVRKIYGKYIFRIFTAFVFWSFVYVCLNCVDMGILGVDFIIFTQEDSHFFKLEMNCAHLTFLCYTSFSSRIPDIRGGTLRNIRVEH